MRDAGIEEVAPDAILRLGTGGAEAFLGDHHLEASRRLVRLIERTRLRQRVTMSYDAARIGGARGRPVQGDLAESAADARRLLSGIARRLPADCWSVLFDICAYDKGLQQLETERAWPRRSAKLVVRIGLDQLALIFGLAPMAEGKTAGSMRGWLPERMPMFDDVAEETVNR